MNLERVLEALGPADITVRGDLEVTDLAYDARTVPPGALFFCVRGAHADGHDFAAEAIARGAVALVVERTLPLAVPQIVVADTRQAMPRAAVAFFGDPSRSLEVAAVTGTNGKTTTAFLLHAVLEAAGRPSGLLTNIRRRVAGRDVPLSGLNTPEAIDLQRLLRAMVDGGDRSCVLEATSGAQVQHRLDGTAFAVLVFTNLTPEHLDLHGTMEAYFAAKAALFDQAAIAVINVSGPYGMRLASTLPDAITFDADSDVLDGIELRLTGGFNRENAIGAVLAARALGIPDEAIRRGIASVDRVPGRFEEIDEGQSFTVIVDYAHTPEALERVLDAARGMGEGRLTVVFGAGGDRDAAKRPLMGAAVAARADRGIVTSDNPRSEDPAAIAAQIARGSAALEIELDRTAAIARALEGARKGDVVVIAGRGAEAVQELSGARRPFDDRDVTRQLLRGGVGGS